MTVSSDVRGPSNWAGKGQPYSRSFAQVCAGAIAPLLDAVEGVIGGLAERQPDKDVDLWLDRRNAAQLAGSY